MPSLIVSLLDNCLGIRFCCKIYFHLETFIRELCSTAHGQANEYDCTKAMRLWIYLCTMKIERNTFKKCGTGPFWVNLSPASHKERVLGVASFTYSPAEQHDSSFPEQPLFLPPAPPALHKLKICGGGKQWWLQSPPPQIAVWVKKSQLSTWTFWTSVPNCPASTVIMAP